MNAATEVRYVKLRQGVRYVKDTPRNEVRYERMS